MRQEPSADDPEPAPRPEPSGPRAIMAWSKQYVSSGQVRLARLIERYNDRPLIALALRIYQRDRETVGTVVGSAIAFRLFLFFVPLVLFVVGLAGLAAGWLDADDVNEGVGVTGNLAEQINAALAQGNRARWVATLLGVLGMATAGRTLGKVLVAASCLAWRLPVTTKASIKVLGSIVGFVTGVGLIAAIVNRIRSDLGLGVAGVSFLAVLAIYSMAWLALSTMLPRATRDPGVLLPGALLVGTVLAGMQAVSQLYLPDRLGRASELYGTIGTAIVTLGWFFILGRAIVLAMAVNAVVEERYGSISEVVFALPLVRVLPRKSARIRRFFDLPEVS